MKWNGGKEGKEGREGSAGAAAEQVVRADRVCSENFFFVHSLSHSTSKVARWCGAEDGKEKCTDGVVDECF